MTIWDSVSRYLLTNLKGTVDPFIGVRLKIQEYVNANAYIFS